MRKLRWAVQGRGDDAVWSGYIDRQVAARVRHVDVPVAGWAAVLVVDGDERPVAGVFRTIENAQRVAESAHG